MKYAFVYTLFLMSVFHTSCGQNKTEVKKNIINLETKGVITSHGPGNPVRKIVQDRKGNIWMASWEGMGVLPIKKLQCNRKVLHRSL